MYYAILVARGWLRTVVVSYVALSAFDLRKIDLKVDLFSIYFFQYHGGHDSERTFFAINLQLSPCFRSRGSMSEEIDVRSSDYEGIDDTHPSFDFGITIHLF